MVSGSLVADHDGLTLGLDALLVAHAGEVHSFLFRTLEYSEDTGDLEILRDGILVVRYGADWLAFEQAYTEQLAEDAYREVHRERTLFLDALSGESAMLTHRFDASEGALYLEFWHGLPAIFYNAVGILNVRGIPDDMPSGISDGETIYYAPEANGSIHVLKRNGLVERCESRVADKTVALIEFERDGLDVPTRVLESVTYPSGALRSAGLYQRVMPQSGAVADLPVVPVNTSLLDLRLPGKASSVMTDRELTLREALVWTPSLDSVPDCVDEPATESGHRASRRGVALALLLVLLAAAVLIWHRIRQNGAGVLLALVPLQTSAVGRPYEDLRERALAALGVGVGQTVVQCPSSSTPVGQHSFAVRSSLPGSTRTRTWMLKRGLGPPWTYPISGRFRLYDVMTVCEQCGVEVPEVGTFLPTADARTVVPDPSLLEIRVGRDGIGRGDLTLRAVKTPVILTRMTSQCALSAGSVFPTTVGGSPVVLSLAWDAHNPVDLGARPLFLEDARGIVGLVRIALQWELEPPKINQHALRFDGYHELAVSIASGDYSLLGVEVLAVPLCVVYEHKLEGNSMVVRETGLARRRHSCGPLVLGLQTKEGGTFERRVAIVHAPLLSPAGMPRLFMHAFPGERLLLIMRRDGSLGMACPDRLPCVESELLAGSRLLASFEAPLVRGGFRAHLETSVGSIEIQGDVQEPRSSLHEAWWKVAGMGDAHRTGGESKGSFMK